MCSGSVGSSITSAVSSLQHTTGQNGPPKAITKADLLDMKEKIAKAGGKAPDGFDKLIENFDQAAGKSGSMTMSQFKSYAEANGVKLPDPGQAPPSGQGPAGSRGRASGQRPAGGGPPPGGAQGSSASSSSTTSAKSEAEMTEAELEVKAAQGDQKAIEELAKRRAAEEAKEVKTPAASDTGVGSSVDASA
jgi:hypothetical protein